MDIEVACESIFWKWPGRKESKFDQMLQDRNCTGLASHFFKFDTAAIGRCALPLSSLTAVHGFMKGCFHHVGTVPPNVGNEFSNLSSSALWAHKRFLSAQHLAPMFSTSTSAGIATAANNDTLYLDSPRQQRRSNNLRTGAVAEIQPGPKDQMHTRWISGPTYSQKLVRCKNSGEWPPIGAEQKLWPLFLRGKFGHCIKSGFVLAQCKGWVDGLGFAFNAATQGLETLVAGQSQTVCAVGDPDFPTAGRGLILASSCKSPAFQLTTGGAVQHLASGLCVAPSNATSAFGTGIVEHA